MLKKLLISIFLAFICSCSSGGGNKDDNNDTPSSSSLAQSNSSSSVAGTFTDPRDGQTYRIVTIGEQSWFAENLNYDGGNGSKGKCYENKAANCNTYGRLYDWNEAKTICPSGWRLPSKKDWEDLIQFAGGNLESAKHLRAKEGWLNCGSCEDTYGFSALPGGYGGSIETGVFKVIGESGLWWTSTETGSNHAYQVFMLNFNDRTYYEMSDGKWFMLSVRCMNGGSEYPPPSSSSSSESVEYFTIKFNTDGGVPATIPEISIAGGIGLKGAPANPRKEGYTFGGWFEGDIQYNSTTLIYKDVTLKAKWNKLEEGGKGEDYTDTRNSQSQIYPTVILNGKRWFAKNLNYDANGSKCYGNTQANCDAYGRLYTWDIISGACPQGWLVPTDEEWEDLIKFAGGKSAGIVLKAKDWGGNDDYDFSALPGGAYNGAAFVGIGSSGSWWTSTNKEGYKAYYYMSTSSESVTTAMDGGVGVPTEFALSVRCVEGN